MKIHVSLLPLLTAVIGFGQQNVPFDKTIKVPVPPTGLAGRKLPKLPMEFDTAEGQRIRVVAVTRALEYPFSAAFLPDGNMLVTERAGRLRIIRGGVLDPKPVAGAQKKGPSVPLPKHDAEVKEGEPVVLGDLKVMPFAIPGHTPGSMAYIFPVKDNGRTHMAGIYAGTVLTPGIVSDEGLATYLKSVRHYKEEAAKAGVDVIMQNHPLMYPLPEMLDQLAGRKKGEPNPFVVGKAEYQKFVDVMEACTEVNIARRK